MDAAGAIEKRYSTKRRNELMKTQSTKTESTTILPPPANTRGELAPFLKAKDLPKKGFAQITLLGGWRKSNSQFGEGIEVPCTLGGKRYTWTIKFDSGNYSRLYERFGNEEWKGVVKVERKEYLGREYVAIVD
jgi:hypothetical protein